MGNLDGLITLLLLIMGVCALGVGFIILMGVCAEYIAQQQKAEKASPIEIPALLWAMIPVGLFLTLTSTISLILHGVRVAVG